MEDALVLDDFMEEIIEMTRDIDYKLHAQGIHFPLLDGFQSLESDDAQIILLAEKDGFVEQITSDGYIEEGTFDKRIEAVINSTKQFMIESGCERVDEAFRFFKETKNTNFTFKTYVCDMIIPINDEKIVQRQFISYFYDPVINDFYQITVSSSPSSMPPKDIVLDKIDIENDKITSKLNEYMNEILNKIDYRKDSN